MKIKIQRALAFVICVIGLLISVDLSWCQNQSIIGNVSNKNGGFLNVIEFGVHNDGTNDTSIGINAAIQAAKAVGGGTVYIPAGNYTCGPIELISNLELYIEAGLY
jgi:polygalacturonase